MVFSNVNGTSSAKGTTSTTATSSERKFPDDKTLKKAAEQLGISVEDLKAHLKKSPTAQGKGIYNLTSVNQMDMKAFCILNGIEHSKWREYVVKSGEQFYVINNPTQYVGNTATPKPAPTPAPVAKPVETPKPTTAPKPEVKPDSTAGKKDTVVTSKSEEVRDPAKAATPSAAENRRNWNSDYTPEELSRKIYDFADNNTKSVGRPDFDALIEQINSKNAVEVILKYNDNPKNKKESLISTITSETGSKPEDRKAAVMHIYDALAKATNANPDNRAKFEKELNDRFEESGFVNTKRMDDMLLRMIATPEIIASQIEKEVDDNRGAVGKNSFNEVLNLINKDNVADVIAAYDKLNTGESIFEAISDETSSDPKDRQQAIGHVFDAYADSLGTPEKVRELFKAELKDQTESVFPMDTKNLDKYVDYMTATPTEIATRMEALIDDNFIHGAVDEREFQVLLNMITTENVVEVLLEYKNLKNSDESLVKAIIREVGDDKDVRMQAVMHIYDALAEKFHVSADVKTNFETELNKEFDKKIGMVKTKNIDDIVDQIVGGATTAGAFVSDLSRFEHSEEQGAKTLTLGNGKKWTAGALKQSAIDSAKKDPGFAKVKNPFIPRPLPYINENGKIEASSELLKPTKIYGPDGKQIPWTMEGKVVILNPGHGGYNSHNGFFDAGTVLSVKNAEGKEMPIEEWRVSDTYTRELATKLQEKGATVLIVAGPVTGDGAMSKTKYLESFLKGEKGSKEIRNLIKSTKKSDIAFMSIHVESVKDSPERMACTVRANNDSGDVAFANSISSHVAQNIAMLTPKACQNDYYVTRAMGKEIPAVLVELGNIANEQVAKSLLSSGDRDKYTDALAASIEDVLLK